MIDAGGNRAEMRFDGFDRQSHWIFPSPDVPGQPGYGTANPADYEAYGYDANGNRTWLRKRDEAKLEYEYDALNRVTLKRVPASATRAAGYSVAYTYDNRGLQRSARFATGAYSGRGVESDFDSVGRQKAARTDMAGSVSSTAYGWDEDGNRISGAGMTYTYDDAGRMKSLASGAGTMVDFAYDPRGGLASATNLWSVVATASVSYGYDAAGRLQTLTQALAGTSADQVWGFTYNPAGQIVTRAGSNDAYGSNTAYPVERGYTVNGLNQYQAAGPATFTYDLNGNLKSDGSTTYVYDAENRLVSASGAKTATLSYDPLGRLWQVTGSGSTTRFFYDGDRLISETDGSGNLLRAYTHGAGADTPLVWWELTPGAGPVRRFLHADHQGSIVAVSDAATGTALAINAYDPWGIPNQTNVSTVSRFGYTGQVWIPELGMWYYKARIYSSTLGRFLQTDPVGYKDQVNLYAYVGNDPVDGRDPSGMRVDYGKDEDGKNLKAMTTDVAKKDPQLAARLSSLESSKHVIKMRFEPDGSTKPGHTRADSLDALKPGKGSGSMVYIPRMGGKVDGLTYTPRDVVAHEMFGHAFDNDKGNLQDRSTVIGERENEASAIKVENIYRGAMHEQIRDVPAVPTGILRSVICLFGLFC